MNKLTVCLLIVALIALTAPSVFAQQNQSTQGQEIETLKKQVLELQKQLQTVENVEKMELAAKLAEANAKLRNAETDKYKRELKDGNNEWLRTWSLWFVGILGFLVVVIGGAFWSWLRYQADQLIANSVERSLNGFNEAVAQVDILKNELIEAVGQVNILQEQVGILEKEHAASVLENFINFYIGDVDSHPEQIRALREEVLLEVFSDETRRIAIKDKAAEVLASRSSTKLVSPALAFLNSVVDSELDLDIDWDTAIDTERYLN